MKPPLRFAPFAAHECAAALTARAGRIGAGEAGLSVAKLLVEVERTMLAALRPGVNIERTLQQAQL
jgi:hypothetical protein